MSDGFSDPDPADVADGDSDDAPGLTWDPASLEMDDRGGILVNGEDGRMLVDMDTSCEDCVHSDVCAAYGQFKMMFEQWKGGGDGPPFDSPEALAIICEMYQPDDGGDGAAPVQRANN